MNPARKAKGEILIVEDNAENLEVLEQLLTRRGYAVRTAGSGEEALEVLKGGVPDLILLDIMMPGMDGFELCERLKQYPETRGIIVMFLTARNDSETIVRAFDAGAVDYIARPFNQAELLARVKTHLELKQTRENLQAALSVLKRDLGRARERQQNILPAELGRVRDLNIEARYLPVVEVGGDIYDVVELKPGIVRVFLADAQGHGIGAALITMAIKGEYETLKTFIEGPAHVLNFLNESFLRKFGSLESFFTCAIADVDLHRGRIIYAGAGHPNQLLLRANGEMVVLENTGAFIGLTADGHYEQKEFDFARGDKLFLYSDGILEEMGEDQDHGKVFGEKRLREILLKRPDASLRDIVNRVIGDLYAYLGAGDRQDDLTFIGLERT